MLKEKKIFYTGLDPSRHPLLDHIFHYPLIKIVPHEIKEDFSAATHILITSPTTSNLLKKYLPKIKEKIFLGVGRASIEPFLNYKCLIAPKQTSEGMVKLLQSLDLKGAHLFYPHSALARDVIIRYLEKSSLLFTETILYTTLQNPEARSIDLSPFSEIIFTSPSTVDAFISIFGKIPYDKKITAIGPITQKYLKGQKYDQKVYIARSSL